MATVYDFSDFYPRHGSSRRHSDEGNKCNKLPDISMIVHALNEKRKTLTKKITEISRDQQMCSSLLDGSLVRIRNSMLFMKQCGKAWKLDDLYEMEARRDILVNRRSMDI